MPIIEHTALKRLLLSRPYVIRGASMTPALLPGDQMLVDASAYRKASPARGDVVVFSSPQAAGRHDVKRVVGLPGERVEMREGTLAVDGREIAEPYLGGLPSSIGLGEASWDLRGDEYFLLGDNRAHSTDSRDFGPVPEAGIVGRAWLRYWPPGRMDAL